MTNKIEKLKKEEEEEKPCNKEAKHWAKNL